MEFFKASAEGLTASFLPSGVPIGWLAGGHAPPRLGLDWADCGINLVPVGRLVAPGCVFHWSLYMAEGEVGSPLGTSPQKEAGLKKQGQR